MKTEENELPPILLHTEPVLAVQDISETVLYWQNTLGFPAKWTWGEPPNHGGVSWQNVFIQFTLQPQLATASKGNSIWIRVERLETLYEFHKNKNAEIVDPLENKPWGMAEYTVRDNNGYYIHFAGNITNREKSAATFPESIRIANRKPTAKEYANLMAAVGWSKTMNDEEAELRLSAAVFAVVAEDITSGEAIGCALLLGDNASYYYVKDVMVHPAWQKKRVGTAIMQALNNWLNTNGADHALVSLISGEGLKPFYQQFGFAQSFGMIKYLHRDNEND